MKPLPLSAIVKSSAAGFALARMLTAALGTRRRVDLRGKVAVVAGGTRGLGLAIAERLARKGCAVAICGRRREDVEGARSELARWGGSVYAEVCDLRHRDDVDRFVRNVAARLGDVDILVTNAATISVAPIEALDASDFERAMESIFDTTLHAVLAVMPSMRARRTGTLAFITSIGGKVGVPHLAPYSAAKFAAVGLSESLRAELAKDHVRVLTVIPGLMRTGSPVHAGFKGDAEKEYAWFATSASAPLLSISADRAARLIVRAIERGAVRLTFTPLARIAVRLHDLVPSLFDLVFTVAGRLLPRVPAGRAGEAGQAGQAGQEREGLEIEQGSRSKLVAVVRGRGRGLARRHGQLRTVP